ncbi:MAG: hypothetical protein WBP93_17630, partial [Pyrinomonadaceae bacterium]
MASNRNYQVFPKRIKPQTVKFSFLDLIRKHGFFTILYYGFGCLAMIILFFVIVALIVSYSKAYGLSPHSDADALFLPLSIIFSVGIVLLIHFLLGKVRISSIENKMSAKANEEETKRLNDEAESLTSSLMQTYESSVSLNNRLSEQLEQASRELKRAEGEYNDNAAYPYWDKVEEAARTIYSYQRTLDELSRNAAYYYRKLSDRKHNFPSFPIKFGIIPSASPVLSEFERVIRLGLRSTHFTNTLGHRRT